MSSSPQDEAVESNFRIGEAVQVEIVSFGPLGGGFGNENAKTKNPLFRSTNILSISLYLFYIYYSPLLKLGMQPVFTLLDSDTWIVI